MLVALLPWLGAKFVPPTAVVALTAARWLRRRQRGLAGLVALEIVIFSVVLYITVNDRLYGGPFPAAALTDPGPTGAHGLAEHLARAPRLLGLWIDRDVGMLRFAPFAALCFVSLWLLVRSRRRRRGHRGLPRRPLRGDRRLRGVPGPDHRRAVVRRPRARVRPCRRRRARSVGPAPLPANRERPRRPHHRRDGMDPHRRARRPGRGDRAAEGPAPVARRRGRPAEAALSVVGGPEPEMPTTSESSEVVDHTHGSEGGVCEPVQAGPPPHTDSL
jgi:hypothetical protein